MTNSRIIFLQKGKNMKQNFKSTVNACFTAYIVQAIVNNFAPLLFVTFQKEFDIPLSQITLLISFNFTVQLLVDLLSAKAIDKIGYRTSMVLAHFLSALGLASLAVLPFVLPSPFIGLLISVMIYAVGGGILEVLVSPIVEACPTDNKEKAMSLLHSFYCWGHMAVVLLSTVFFNIFGIENWRIVAMIWAILPIINGIVFAKVPIANLIDSGEKGMSIKELFTSKVFIILFIMMVCSGASEQAISQWVSTFAKESLGISKTVGDLARTSFVRTADGHITSTLRQIRRQNFAKEINSYFVHCVYRSVFSCIAFTDTGSVADRLLDLRLLRGNYVAGNILDFVGNAHQRRNGNVCTACTRRRPRLPVPGPSLGRLRVVNGKGKPKSRHPRSHNLP